MDALVLRPYRFPGVDRLLIVTTVSPDDRIVDREDTSAADYREWKQRATTIQQWGMYEWWDANLSGVDVPEQVAGFRVTPGYFALLGSAPAMGREFVDGEAVPGSDRRVVIGHGLWQRRFAGDPAIVGKMVRFDGEPYEVVGVAPERFAIPDGAEVWAPLALTDERWANRRDNHYGAIARLGDGQSVDSARAELTAIIDTQRKDFPDTNHSRYAKVMTFTEGMADPGAGAFLGVWQVAALLLLLIACANIANLLLARGAERSQEYAVRLAMGANRVRLFTQTVIEGLVLASVAVVLAMPLTSLSLSLSKTAIPTSVLRFIPGWTFIKVDTSLFIATALLGTVAMLVFSCVPAVQAMRAQVANTLRQAGRSLTPGRNRQMLRSVLATTQVALALALLFGSTLAIGAANQTVNGVLGFDKQNVLVASVSLPERTYADAEKRRRFINGVIDSMRRIPAVTEAGLTSAIPAGFNNNARQFYPEGVELKESEARFVDFRRSTPGFFQALRIPLISGRWFDDSDRLDGLQVAVVSASVARRYWPNQDALGKRFKMSPTGNWVTVIGVCGDVVHNWFIRRSETIYRPLTQEVPYGGDFAIRTVGDPEALAGDVRRAVAAMDPDQPLALLVSLEQQVEDRAAGFTFIARALGVVAVIALVLSIVGIYSLMAFLTAQRTQEIGVRMALGAGSWQVVRLATRRALHITIVGTVVGGALALAVGRLLQSVLFGMVDNNTLVLLPLIAALAIATLLAAYFPARRAARIDPMAALRES
jgi:predicted permease